MSGVRNQGSLRRVIWGFLTCFSEKPIPGKIYKFYLSGKRLTQGLAAKVHNTSIIEVKIYTSFTCNFLKLLTIHAFLKVKLPDNKQLRTV